MHRTMNEIRSQGLQALREKLGQAGLIRFLQQFDPGYGDYAEDRHAWVDAHDLDAIVDQLQHKNDPPAAK